MIVETKVVGRPTELTDRELALPPGPGTLRDLIGVLVRQEVEEFARRKQDRTLLRVLTPADLARGHDAGKFGAEARSGGSAPSVGDATDRAIQAFEDDLYFVFLDGIQIEQLDDIVTPGPDSRLRFVRLVALAGG